jgi:hypothetical protein
MFRKVLTVPWLIFVAWMAVYGMVVSALLGLVGGWALWPPPPNRPSAVVSITGALEV